MWTISGIYFAYNKIEMVRGEQYRLPLETEYRIFKRLGQEIIEKNENGLKTYLTYPDNLPVNNLLPSEVINIAKEKTSLNPTEVSLIETAERGAEFRGRRLPIYKVSTDTKDDINIYIDPITGDVAAIRSDSWRAWDLLWALHIMDYQDRDNINNILLKIFSILALVSSISGVILFFRKTI